MNPSPWVALLLGLGGARVPLDGLPVSERPTSLFDARSALGRPDANERADALDVPAYFRALAARALPGGGSGDDVLRSLGDVLAFLRPAPGALHVDARLAELARRAPALGHEVGWILPQLVHEEGYRDTGWKGRKDLADDGFLSLRGWWPWHGFYHERWPRFDRSTKVQAYQVVTLVFHDVAAERAPRDAAEALARVRRAARGFEGCRSWRGLSLRVEEAALVPGSTWIAPGGAELSYRVRYELARAWPPPFVVDVRERMDEGDLVVDYTCADGPWRFFAGREEYIPVHDSRGAFVCLLLVGTFAAAEIHGDILLRESLGNVKELAERSLFTAEARSDRQR